LQEGVDNIVKQLTNSNGESTAVCELVKSQLTCFLQSIWVHDQLKTMSDAFEKEKELLLVSKNNSSIAKLEDDLRQLETFKRKAEKESQELKGIVSKLVEEKGKRETEVDNLKKKVSALCSKIFLLELEAQPQAQQAALASAEKFDIQVCDLFLEQA
jgi:predicted nuclease with TOPRIM domain